MKTTQAAVARRQPDVDIRYHNRLTLSEGLAGCEVEGIRGMTLATLATMKIPPRRTLLASGTTPIIRAGQLGQAFAARGVGKTWFILTVALIMASGGSAMGYHAPDPSRVLYVDGEMALEDLQDRVKVIVDCLGLDPASVAENFVMVAADGQDEPWARLDTPEGQEKLEPLVDWADVVILDNRSCLFSSEGEKDPTAWEPAAAWMMAMRRRKKACVLVHHTSRQGGARGHGKAEDSLDFIIKLENPDGYDSSQGARFTIEFTKSRGIAGGSALLPRTIHLTPNGWVVEGVASKPTAANAIEDRIITKVSEGKFRTKNAALADVTGKATTKGKVWDDLVANGHLKKDGEFWVAVRKVAEAAA